MVLGVVFIDGEMVLAEELQQGAEVLGGEVERVERRGIGLEQAAVQIRDAGAGGREEIAGAVSVVQGIEEEGDEPVGVEAMGVLLGGREGEVAGEEIGIAASLGWSWSSAFRRFWGRTA